MESEIRASNIPVRTSPQSLGPALHLVIPN